MAQVQGTAHIAPHYTPGTYSGQETVKRSILQNPDVTVISNQPINPPFLIAQASSTKLVIPLSDYRLTQKKIDQYERRLTNLVLLLQMTQEEINDRGNDYLRKYLKLSGIKHTLDDFTGFQLREYGEALREEIETPFYREVLQYCKTHKPITNYKTFRVEPGYDQKYFPQMGTDPELKFLRDHILGWVRDYTVYWGTQLADPNLTQKQKDDLTLKYHYDVNGLLMPVFGPGYKSLLHNIKMHEYDRIISRTDKLDDLFWDTLDEIEVCKTYSCLEDGVNKLRKIIQEQASIFQTGYFPANRETMKYIENAIDTINRKQKNLLILK